MRKYEIEFTTAAAKEMRKLEKDVLRRVSGAIDGLATTPRPNGAKKMKGEKTAWRIRVGDNRIIYDIFDERLLITVVRIGHRREIYR